MKPIKKESIATVAMIGVVNKELLLSAVVGSDSKMRLLSASGIILLDCFLLCTLSSSNILTLSAFLNPFWGNSMLE